MSFRIIITLAILFAIDLYVFQGVKVLLAGRAILTQRIWTIVYWSITVFSLGTIVTGQFIDWHEWPKVLRTYTFAIIVIIYMTKIILSLFLVIDDVIRLFRVIAAWVGVKFFSKESSEAFSISRLNFLVKTGFAIAAIPFVSLLYGMAGGAYNFRVRKVPIRFPNLPDSFHGLKVIQISDLHTGSYMGTNHLTKAVTEIMNQKPDLIFFTGDLVNDLHTEVLEFKEVLSQLKAPMGVYSILGNHDYGDYYKWTDLHSKEENLQKLKDFQGEIGWKLLLNEHTYIEREGHKIGLVGVENYSGRGNFSRYGDINKATNGFEQQPFNILLTHDPSHWDAQIRTDHQYFDLTLSGHTHGFQFGVEIPGFKWSPVQYVYRQWADLYRENDQYLYVNRGLGFIGYPGRVGILPEITLFELSKA